jgi:hypothetical protein
MKRITLIALVITVVLGFLLLLLAAVNLLWIFLYLLCVIAGALIIWKFRDRKYAKPFAAALSLVALLVGWFFGFLGIPGESHSIKRSIVPLLRDASQSDINLLPQPDPLIDQKRDFDDTRYYRYKQRIEPIRVAKTFQTDSREVLIAARKGKIGNEKLQSTLDNAINELDESVKKFWDEDRLQKIEELLDSARDSITASEDFSEIKTLRQDFDKKYAEISLDAIYENITQVQVALDALMKKYLDGMIEVQSHLVARLDEEGKRLFLDEHLVFTSKGPIVKVVDITDIVRLTNYSSLEKENVEKDILLSYEECSNSSSILKKSAKHFQFFVQRDRKNFCVIHRVTIPVNIEKTGKRWQIARFPSFTLRWPQIYDAKVFLELDFDNELIGKNRLPHAIELKRNRPIEQVYLPKNSFFHATLSADHNVLADHDDINLKSSGATITPEFFLRYPYVWIEFLPDSVFFRNAFVQKGKQFLFPENTAMALLVCIAGLFLGIILGPEKS